MAPAVGKYHYRLSNQAVGIRNNKRLEFKFGITDRRETGFIHPARLSVLSAEAQLKRYPCKASKSTAKAIN